ncbi:MAG TPA: hypothetical protein PLM49_07450, partial [Bacteroidales bacterium]|nr:hypothetical protein [Bacteroidales bacterium]
GQADILFSTDETERESYLDYLNKKSIDLIEYLKKGREKIDNVFYLNIHNVSIIYLYADFFICWLVPGAASVVLREPQQLSLLHMQCYVLFKKRAF